MKLTKPQQLISDDRNRFRVAACGRRFGKTFLAINEMAKYARHPNKRILSIANTYRQVKGTIWDELKNQMYRVNWVKKINESDLSIELINGSKIFLRSADNKDALRGAKYDFIVMDECADINPDTWYSVLRPTLADTKGHALFIGSPKGRNWFYDLWVQGGATEDWSSYQYTTIEGGQVDLDEIEAARRDTDVRRFEQEYEAQFVSYEGVIFYAFTEDNVQERPILPNARTPLHIFVDFNINPMSAVIAEKQGEHIHMFDEIEIWSSNTFEMVKEIRRRYGSDRQMFVYPDASGSHGSTNSAGVSNHMILQNNGFILRTPNKNPPIVDSIASVNSRFRSSNGDINLTLSPACARTRECLIKHTYKENTRIPTKDQGYDHLTDCIRYGVHGMFPLKQDFQGQVMAPRRQNAGRMLR